MKTDVSINVHQGSFKLTDPRELFSASLPEGTEVAGGKSIPGFWSISSSREGLFLKVKFPEKNKAALLRFSLESSDWDLWIDWEEGSIDPLEYPLDGLILYYLSVMKNDIMMHASGINIEGKGIIFSGVSGKGKSTLASIFREQGAGVIHDDRIILRRMKDGYTMHNTPVYSGEEPRESGVDKIFLISHGNKNKVHRLTGAKGISGLMSNCIQHNWGHDIISRLLASASDLFSRVPVYGLEFVPDKNVVKFILENE